jgi:hypothetical protein
LLGAALLLLSLAGCGDSNILEGVGDKNSKEAQTEAALMAMDDGDYQTAIDLLTTLVQNHPGDAQLLQYLSSAYAGAAGLDTLNILEVIDTLDEAGQEGSIDMVGLTLGGADGALTSAQVAAKLENINNAIATLNLIQDPNTDQTIHLGVLSMAHLSLALADLIMTDLGSADVVLTEAGIDAQYGGNPADFSAAPSATLTAIEEDVANMDAAVAALDAISGESNDLASDMADFQNDIDQGADGQIAPDDLEHYVDNL